MVNYTSLVAGQFRNAIIVIYSLLVMATYVPSFRSIPNTVVIPYFLFIPGYCMTSMVSRQSGSVTEKVFYSLAWSTTLLVTFYALTTLGPGFPSLPNVLVIPVITLAILTYNYFHGK